ncbi:MAG: HIT domain-containing protein [Christensenellaceae bacterium]|jgi:histidine triad (HIT) family protein|nr:HIT domain-containing protein [Christensenellaceae bacterium]
MDNCTFCKIIAGIIPVPKVYEDENMIIIKDIAPQAKLHYLMIPKEHYANIIEMDIEQSAILGKCLKTLSNIVNDLGLQNGFRLVSNKGTDACQSVEHLHVHILGGEQLTAEFGRVNTIL